MGVLHATPKGKDPVLCWCKERHSSAQAVALNLRDTTPRTYPQAKPGAWDKEKKGKKKGIPMKGTRGKKK